MVDEVVRIKVKFPQRKLNETEAGRRRREGSVRLEKGEWIRRGSVGKREWRRGGLKQ